MNIVYHDYKRMQAHIDSKGYTPAVARDLFYLQVAKTITDELSVCVEGEHETADQVWLQRHALAAKTAIGNVNELVCIDLAEVYQLAFNFWALRYNIAHTPSRFTVGELFDIKSFENKMAPRYIDVHMQLDTNEGVKLVKLEDCEG